MNRVTDPGELDEDEMLMRAIAMSLEEEEEEVKEEEELEEVKEETEQKKFSEEELNFPRHQGSGELLKKTSCKKMYIQSDRH